MKIPCDFLPVFFEHHQSLKYGRTSLHAEDYNAKENIWMGMYGVGKLETYQAVYGKCHSLEDLEDWLIQLKGLEQVVASAEAFQQWVSHRGTASAVPDARIGPAPNGATSPGSADSSVGASAAPSLLSDEQRQSWAANGYIRINLVDPLLCGAVTDLICTQLGIDLLSPDTWYPSHPDWHGLMFQRYQDPCIQAIKSLPSIRQLFSELYGTQDLIPNTEKVSYNPPETTSWTFRHNKLHWDIDFAKSDLTYIQGLVYLNDVPEGRGPLTVVPGFHRRFTDWIAKFPNPHKAQEEMQNTLTGTPIPGKKGDVLLWLQTLPHAASSNHSDLPRFVQYVSFTRMFQA